MLSVNHQGRSQTPSSATTKDIKVNPRSGLSSNSAQWMLAALGLGVLVMSCLSWRYQSVRSSQAWLDRHQAKYNWYHGVWHPDSADFCWRKFQAQMALVVGDAWLSDLYTVTLDKPSLTDDDLRPLSRLSSVQVLSLSSDMAGDPTLARIAQLKKLHSVKISGQQFTFEGLLKLRSLPRLRSLELSNMHLSMAELAVLESALPLANMKYNESDEQATYEREVVGRYPKVPVIQGAQQFGFAPLIQTKKSGEELPVSSVAREPETLHAS